MPFATIPEVLTALKERRMVVLVDDEHRENEGDLVMAAEYADAPAVAFMATKGCGLICLAMDGATVDRLGLPLMSRDNRSRLGTAFTVSIEAREGVSTGISAADRARTIQVAIDPSAGPQDLVTPGHVFPLRARDGGVLVRPGHSEASVDLCRLAGLRPASVICEIMKPNGEMARLPDLERYCVEHGLLLATIADLIAWREQTETSVALAAEALVPTAAGDFRGYLYRNTLTGEHHLALVSHPDLGPGKSSDRPVLVRVQKEHLLGDVFGLPGRRLPLGGLRQLTGEGGIFLYMRDNRSLPEHLVALGGRDHRQGQAPDLPMDLRDYGVGAQILRHLGVRSMRLITGSDQHLSALSGYGLTVVERVVPTA
jgi:3,4-dihydroxy 2-butanone 4-phosphate synthase/GTP cyclohydrolase II